MTKSFRKIDPKVLSDNVFKLLDIDKFLVTAGTKDHFNTMTAGWGGLGSLWYKSVAFCFIRPQRFTFQFTEKHDFFTMCFFKNEYKSVLDFCGNNSGKDIDKIQKTGLIPLETETGTIYFEQSKLVFECRKLYAGFIHENGFIDKSIVQKVYPARDFHIMYIGEIINCLVEI